MREEVIQIFDDITSIAFEVKYRGMKGGGIKTVYEAKVMKGRGIKILLIKQILQKLPILLHKYKAIPLKI